MLLNKSIFLQKKMFPDSLKVMQGNLTEGKGSTQLTSFY